MSSKSRVLARVVSRRFSSSGKILSEEEKAAENIYIKKIEKEKLEKLARKGPNPEEKPPTGSADSGSASEAKATGQKAGDSTDKTRNYVVLAGVVAGLGALGWYFQSKKKPEEVQG
ncbi:hypothetical protein DCAR_0313824 [Daucus carota subsp. sativus]|uniref:F1F0-ATPase inhibitor protein n=1 Tax=Daucus carota subsp. sativus TaxID=79200 RepID=A0AAF1AT99_DAUCS|nr:hypothetical protein DCAR_0313824 [Daucus carota subsp. sativus]